MEFSNPTLTNDQIRELTSVHGGLTTDTVKALKKFGCQIIQMTGKLMKLPQVCVASGQALFHQFYALNSMFHYPLIDIAMGCILLSSKIEECPKRCREVVHTFHMIMQYYRPGLPFFIDYSESLYATYRERVTTSEMILLKELGFHVKIYHPYGLLINYLKFLDLNEQTKICQRAWNFLNDSFKTIACICYQPNLIACACIYLAARDFQYPLPDSPPWYDVFDCDESDLRVICGMILESYQIKTEKWLPLNTEELEYYKSHQRMPDAIMNYSYPVANPELVLKEEEIEFETRLKREEIKQDKIANKPASDFKEREERKRHDHHSSRHKRDDGSRRDREQSRRDRSRDRDMYNRHH